MINSIKRRRSIRHSTLSEIGGRDFKLHLHTGWFSAEADFVLEAQLLFHPVTLHGVLETLFPLSRVAIVGGKNIPPDIPKLWMKQNLLIDRINERNLNENKGEDIEYRSDNKQFYHLLWTSRRYTIKGRTMLVRHPVHLWSKAIGSNV